MSPICLLPQQVQHRCRVPALLGIPNLLIFLIVIRGEKYAQFRCREEISVRSMLDDFTQDDKEYIYDVILGY